MLIDFLPILISILFAVTVAGGLIGVSYIFGPKRAVQPYDDTYECGAPPISDARHKINVKFYTTAVLFIIFDIEIIYIVPWAVVVREFIRSGEGAVIISSMLLFLLILIAGLIYVYRSKVIEWNR